MESYLDPSWWIASILEWFVWLLTSGFDGITGTSQPITILAWSFVLLATAFYSLFVPWIFVEGMKEATRQQTIRTLRREAPYLFFPEAEEHDRRWQRDFNARHQIK
jgi:hypothetical protein